jgi:hypothetical protein
VERPRRSVTVSGVLLQANEESTLAGESVRALGLVARTAFLIFVPVSAVLMSVALGKPPQAHELLGVAMVVAALLIHTLALRQAGPAPSRSVHTTPATAAP